jgi:hypothetical protein
MPVDALRAVRALQKSIYARAANSCDCGRGENAIQGLHTTVHNFNAFVASINTSDFHLDCEES